MLPPIYGRAGVDPPEASRPAVGALLVDLEVDAPERRHASDSGTGSSRANALSNDHDTDSSARGLGHRTPQVLFRSSRPWGRSPSCRPRRARIDQFGMRSIGASPDGFVLLNGRPVYLRGALDQDYYPHGLYTAFSDAELDEQFARAKHMGLNCLRTHIKIADPRYYDAADRAGLLIWTELPNWQELTDSAKRRARETMVGMVERDWNHPSIVIWTIVNENWGTDLAVNATHRAWLVGMYNELKHLDPQRLVVGNSPCFTNFHVITDIEDFHNYYGMPDHHRQWKEWVAGVRGAAGLDVRQGIRRY